MARGMTLLHLFSILLQSMYNLPQGLADVAWLPLAVMGEDCC